MRRSPTRTLATLALSSALALLLPAAAQARRVIAPPGTSGVDQYVEVVPSAEGNVPVNGGTGHGGALPKATRQQLEASGSEGRAAASFAQSTGATPATRHHGGGGRSAHSKGSAGGAGGNRGGGSPPPIGPAVQSAAQSGAGGGGGLGAGLPIALGAIALIAGAAFLIRRRAG